MFMHVSADFFRQHSNQITEIQKLQKKTPYINKIILQKSVY